MRAFAGVTLGILGGCTVLVPLDDYAGVAPTPDATAADANAADTGMDARVEGDAGDAAPAADASLPNLVTNGDFEAPSGTECGDPWNGFQSTLTLSSEAHTGAGACRVCTSGASAYTIDGFDVLGVKAGESFTASVWVRAPSGVTPSGKIIILIRLAKGAQYPEASESVPVDLTTAWQRIEVKHTTGIAPDRLNVYVEHFQAAPDACFLVDDFAVSKLP